MLIPQEERIKTQRTVNPASQNFIRVSRKLAENPEIVLFLTHRYQMAHTRSQHIFNFFPGLGIVGNFSIQLVFSLVFTTLAFFRPRKNFIIILAQNFLTWKGTLQFAQSPGNSISQRLIDHSILSLIIFLFIL